MSESENFSYFVRILQDIRKSHFLIILRNIRKATDHAKCPQLASSTRNISRYSNSGLLGHFQNPRLHIFVTMKPRKCIAMVELIRTLLVVFHKIFTKYLRNFYEILQKRKNFAKILYKFCEKPREESDSDLKTDKSTI